MVLLSGPKMSFNWAQSNFLKFFNGISSLAWNFFTNIIPKGWSWNRDSSVKFEGIRKRVSRQDGEAISGLRGWALLVLPWSPNLGRQNCPLSHPRPLQAFFICTSWLSSSLPSEILPSVSTLSNRLFFCGLSYHSQTWHMTSQLTQKQSPRLPSLVIRNEVETWGCCKKRKIKKKQRKC